MAHFGWYQLSFGNLIPVLIAASGQAKQSEIIGNSWHYSVHPRSTKGDGLMMDDKAILNEISRLMAEEHRLETEAVGHGPDNPEHEQLKRLETTLDQCWDLLRQRRARREFGQDPDQAQVRDAATVERYLQ